MWCGSSANSHLREARRCIKTETALDSTAVNPDAGAELALAYDLLLQARVPSDHGTRILVAECIRLESVARGGLQKAHAFILAQALIAKTRGERVNRFWFTDQKYLDAGPVSVGVWDGTPSSPEERTKTLAEEMGQDWCQKAQEKAKAGERLTPLQTQYLKELELGWKV